MPEDDPNVADDEVLLRRIAPGQVQWGEAGGPEISSAAFRELELSVNIKSTMLRDGRAVKDSLRGHSGFGLAAFTARHARSLDQAVFPEPTPEEPAHGVVHGRKSRSIARKLRDGAAWIVLPARPPAP